jgi:uncharacterized membrane-anchored protein YhcB (DUF1043 family)
VVDLVGNEENGYPVSDSNKTLKKILDMVKQKVQDALKKFQNTTSKELEKTQKQLNEYREYFNKHQSETKDTIKEREMK